MTTIGAGPRVGTALGVMGTEKEERTVSAPLPLVGTIMMTGGEAIVRPHVADHPWTTTRAADTTIPTGAVDPAITLPRTRT